MKTAKILFISAVILIPFSCKKSDITVIPNVSVDFNVYLSEPSNSSLNSVGNWVYISGYGVRGIIVYHQSLEVFTAFDRACPYDYNLAASHIDVDSINTTFIDRNCGSKFDIFNGTHQAGPAAHDLKRYAADYDGSNIVRVHN